MSDLHMGGRPPPTIPYTGRCRRCGQENLDLVPGNEEFDYVCKQHCHRVLTGEITEK